MLHHALIITANREYVQAMRHGLLALGHGLARIDVELDALRATQLAPQQYELILIDSVIDTIDGLQLLTLIKPQAPACKFIIVSDATDENTRATAYQNGADFFLARPNSPGEMEMALEAVKGVLKPGKSKGPGADPESSNVIDVVELVRSHCQAGDSVLLAVRSQFQGGDIFIYRGEVYHAQYPGKSGEAAFADILRWDGGMLRVREIKLTHTPPKTIDTSFRLLLETIKKAEEPTPVPAPRRADTGLIVVAAEKPSETAALAVIKEAPPREDDDDSPAPFPDLAPRAPGAIKLPRVNSHWMVNLSGDLLEGSQVSESDRCAFITTFIFRKMADVAVALELEYFDSLSLLGPHLQQVLVADNMGVRHAVFETAWTTEEMRVQYIKWCREQSF
jgi:CheY-like chemotaxis protein